MKKFLLIGLIVCYWNIILHICIQSIQTTFALCAINKKDINLGLQRNCILNVTTMLLVIITNHNKTTFIVITLNFHSNSLSTKRFLVFFPFSGQEWSLIYSALYLWRVVNPWNIWMSKLSTENLLHRDYHESKQTFIKEQHF